MGVVQNGRNRLGGTNTLDFKTSFLTKWSNEAKVPLSAAVDVMCVWCAVVILDWKKKEKKNNINNNNNNK